MPSNGGVFSRSPGGVARRSHGGVRGKHLVTVTSISPSTGTTPGGASVTITGTGFATGASVYFDTTSYPATSVTVVNSTTITCTTPAHTGTGAVNVIVTNTDLSTGTLSLGFTYYTIVLSTINPTSGYGYGGDTVIATGSYFRVGCSAQVASTGSYGTQTVATRLTGTVATAGTTALVGTGTHFTDWNVGTTIVVDGETSRTINGITDATHATVSVAFSNTASGIGYFASRLGYVTPIFHSGNCNVSIVNPDTEQSGTKLFVYSAYLVSEFDACTLNGTNDQLTITVYPGGDGVWEAGWANTIQNRRRGYMRYLMPSLPATPVSSTYTLTGSVSASLRIGALHARRMTDDTPSADITQWANILAATQIMEITYPTLSGSVAITTIPSAGHYLCIGMTEYHEENSVPNAGYYWAANFQTLYLEFA